MFIKDNYFNSWKLKASSEQNTVSNPGTLPLPPEGPIVDGILGPATAQMLFGVVEQQAFPIISHSS